MPATLCRSVGFADQLSTVPRPRVPSPAPWLVGLLTTYGAASERRLLPIFGVSAMLETPSGRESSPSVCRYSTSTTSTRRRRIRGGVRPRRTEGGLAGTDRCLQEKLRREIEVFAEGHRAETAGGLLRAPRHARRLPRSSPFGACALG